MRPKSIAIVAAAITSAASAAAVHGAELKGFAYVCGQSEGKPQICGWHKVIAAAPKGWVEDETWTKRYQALTLFPNGDKSNTKPLIYVRAHHGDKNLSIEDYIAGAQERWKKKLPDSTIDAQPDLKREGKPTFKVYLYKNPSQRDQAFELTAFMKDVDAANPQNTFFFQAVLVSPDKAQLEKAKPAFLELLGKI